TLEDVFVPLYFYHRYQTEAAVKSIGGLDYNYSVKGDGQLVWQPLPVAEQQRALDAVLKTMSTEVLAIPEDKLKLFPPRAYGYGRSRESFKSEMGVAFDALGAAATATDMTLGLLLHPERMNRLIQQKAMNSQQLGLDSVLDQLLDAAFSGDKKASAYAAEISQTVQFATVQKLLSALKSPSVLPQAKALINQEVNRLSNRVAANAFGRQLLLEIENFRKHPEKFEVIAPPTIPDGSPIGSYQCPITKL
ncbi:MAG: peptidase, partial [Flavobacteriaceae bacterium]|nr:peptidase [Flavobacteriaceae bacterium]